MQEYTELIRDDLNTYYDHHIPTHHIPLPVSEYLSEEVADALHVLFPLLVLWHVTALREGEPLHLWERSKVRSNDTVLRFVVMTVQQESWNLNFLDVLND